MIGDIGDAWRVERSIVSREGFVALISKGAMASGHDGLFEAGGVDVGSILSIKTFSELARAFVESSGEAFHLKDNRIVPATAGRKFIKLIRRGCVNLDKVYAFEPYAALVMEEVKWPEVCSLLDHVKYGGNSPMVFEALNGLTDHIRDKGRMPAFRRKLNSYHRSANKNYKGLLGYEKALFDCHSRMLVLRIDLFYRKGFCKARQEMALEHRKRLFDNSRSNKLFRHMLGYVTKLEHGMEKGFHFHCMFFFDGSREREDITLAKRIGEYWVSVITEGMGGYYNCNYAKEKYRYCGIGMVAHSDLEKREGLRMAMVYLTKTDLYMRLKAKGRALTRGVMPGVHSGKGRPRGAA